MAGPRGCPVGGHDAVGSYAVGFALVGGVLLFAAIAQLRLRDPATSAG
jgi:hypothetical protein